MASLRDIRRNIKSVKNTQQITYAMKMVSAARIKRVQNAILSSRPFAMKMERMMKDLNCEMGEEDFRSSPAFRLFEARKDASAELLVLVASDKGLCGAFNANLFRTAVRWLKERQSRKIYAAVAGKKARDFLKRIKGLDLEIIHEAVGIFPHAGYVHAEMLGSAVLDCYETKPVAGVTMIYNEFKSLVAQKTEETPLLPLKAMILQHQPGDECAHKAEGEDFSFEPEKKVLLESLLPRYVKSQLYRILLESQAAELAARMNAMESASKNAGEIIDALTLKLNRTRQSMITKELSEIVSGAEALNG
ncbi:MAG: ATP synthase F1 subunit gamma [bacterium]